MRVPSKPFQILKSFSDLNKYFLFRKVIYYSLFNKIKACGQGTLDRAPRAGAGCYSCSKPLLIKVYVLGLQKQLNF
jgi:hypothetical protein